MRAQSRSLRYEAAGHDEIGRIQNGVHTPKILPVAIRIIIAQLPSNRNEIFIQKSVKNQLSFGDENSS